MVEISNVKVYDLEESIIACRNAMRLEPSRYFNETLNGYKTESQVEDWKKSLERAKKLAAAPSNSGHANFLTGIRVSFDIKYPNYISPEMQRYHWFDIVTSSSKMHTLVKMADDPGRYNKYVNQVSLNNMKSLMDNYNEACETGTAEDQYEAFMMLVSNCPQGIELFMRVSTNYMQLRTIYAQRKNHKLKEDWGAVCKMIEELPYAKEFLLGPQKEEPEPETVALDYNVKNRICDKCGSVLQFENIVLTSLPPQYPYVCPKCGKRYIYRTDETRYEV